MKESDTEVDLKYAYKLEEQMLAVAEAQQTNKLHQRTFNYYGYFEVKELQTNWIILVSYGCKLAQYDCDLSILDNLVHGSQLTEIYVRGNRPDLCFGRFEQLSAAILTVQNQPIYKSPLFDLEAYLAKNPGVK